MRDDIRSKFNENIEKYREDIQIAEEKLKKTKGNSKNAENLRKKIVKLSNGLQTAENDMEQYQLNITRLNQKMRDIKLIENAIRRTKNSIEKQSEESAIESLSKGLEYYQNQLSDFRSQANGYRKLLQTIRKRAKYVPSTIVDINDEAKNEPLAYGVMDKSMRRTIEEFSKANNLKLKDKDIQELIENGRIKKAGKTYELLYAGADGFVFPDGAQTDFVIKRIFPPKAKSTTKKTKTKEKTPKENDEDNKNKEGETQEQKKRPNHGEKTNGDKEQNPDKPPQKDGDSNPTKKGKKKETDLQLEKKERLFDQIGADSTRKRDIVWILSSNGIDITEEQLEVLAKTGSTEINGKRYVLKFLNGGANDYGDNVDTEFRIAEEEIEISRENPNKTDDAENKGRVLKQIGADSTRKHDIAWILSSNGIDITEEQLEAFAKKGRAEINGKKYTLKFLNGGANDYGDNVDTEFQIVEEELSEQEKFDNAVESYRKSVETQEALNKLREEALARIKRTEGQLDGTITEGAARDKQDILEGQEQLARYKIELAKIDAKINENNKIMELLEVEYGISRKDVFEEHEEDIVDEASESTVIEEEEISVKNGAKPEQVDEIEVSNTDDEELEVVVEEAPKTEPGSDGKNIHYEIVKVEDTRKKYEVQTNKGASSEAEEKTQKDSIIKKIIKKAKSIRTAIEEFFTRKKLKSEEKVLLPEHHESKKSWELSEAELQAVSDKTRAIQERANSQNNRPMPGRNEKEK